MFPTRILLSAALISTALAGPWANICASRSSNEIRTCDSYGCGQYSAQRTQRHHPGVDVLCSDGSVVYAPFTGKIVGQEKPYRNKNAINDGVRLSGRDPTSERNRPPCKSGIPRAVYIWATGQNRTPPHQMPLVLAPYRYSQQGQSLTTSTSFCVKIFYIKPIKYKGSIRKGEKLGTLLPLQKVYPGIQSHVHIENCDSSDPTAYL